MSQKANNILTIDLETTKLPIIHPWMSKARICSIGYALNDDDVTVHILDHVSEPVEPQSLALKKLQEAVNTADIIIAHNAKFELNWLKTLGIKLDNKRVWCTLVVDYLINGQYRLNYDLTTVATRYNLGSKIDLMKQYWEDGYETDAIPLDVHIPYLTQDVLLARNVYKHQRAIVDANGLASLVALTCEVTDILSDMEVLGIKFDKDAAVEHHARFSKQLGEIDEQVFETFGQRFNLASPAQLSAHLYGGAYKVDGVESYTVTLKDGTVKPRSRKCKILQAITGAGIKPLDGTESDSNPGTYSTGVKVLKLLRADTEQQQKILDLLKDRSKIDKIIEMFQSNNGGGLINACTADYVIHPQFNQAVTVTGRLSSKEPE